jgi:hypothetical protein
MTAGVGLMAVTRQIRSRDVYEGVATAKRVSVPVLFKMRVAASTRGVTRNTQTGIGKECTAAGRWAWASRQLRSLGPDWACRVEVGEHGEDSPVIVV